ncbi:nonribosomal peptide synthase [Histoplasma capsulatum var. duboisii H88]|uniref:Nonribosomal peptide synthase n=1 Tax=Ajellomyces capsulatus (strain H88) TaxID=544711 RepID=A0A8A1LTJ0_AJEC8|nr:nonribosomal peptide synthase [Histoplasma capsulatum var. duboisii H88]
MRLYLAGRVLGTMYHSSTNSQRPPIPLFALNISEMLCHVSSRPTFKPNLLRLSTRSVYPSIFPMTPYLHSVQYTGLLYLLFVRLPGP